jgi:uncharacterized DUF497 family protein
MSCIAYTIEVRCSSGTTAICARSEAHRIKTAEVETALSNDPILIHEQNVEGEVRYVYYGETESGWLLAVVFIEREEKIRVVTAYDLDAGQKKDYLARRLRGE